MQSVAVVTALPLPLCHFVTFPLVGESRRPLRGVFSDWVSDRSQRDRPSPPDAEPSSAGSISPLHLRGMQFRIPTSEFRIKKAPFRELFVLLFFLESLTLFTDECVNRLESFLGKGIAELHEKPYAGINKCGDDCADKHNLLTCVVFCDKAVTRAF